MCRREGGRPLWLSADNADAIHEAGAWCAGRRFVTQLQDAESAIRDRIAAYLDTRRGLGSGPAPWIRTNDGERQSVRVARAVPVEFDLRSGKASVLTQDISATGLSALVGEAPALGTVAPFRLKLSRGAEPIAGRCRVVANIPTHGSVRMAATFEEITKEGRSRIETLVYGAICSEIRVMLRSGQPQRYPATAPPAVP
jgi:hypothetical protein